MTSLNIYDVLKRMPHRYPFLLIDKVLEVKPNHSITAIKNVTFNEPVFQGHFPEVPIFPGVMLIEAMAQATGILAFESISGLGDSGDLFMLVAVDNARFKRQVIPGDVLTIKAEVITRKRNIWKFNAVLDIDGELACAAEIMGAMAKPA